MWQISLARILRFAWILGLGGAAVTWLTRSPKEAVSFLVGAAISMVTIQSWGRLGESLAARATASSEAPAGRKPASPGAAALFMVFRYLLIAVAIYATIKVLGVTPVAMLVGLLVSFLAVVIELLYHVFRPR